MGYDAGYNLTLYITNGTYCYKGEYTTSNGEKIVTNDTYVSGHLPDHSECPAISAYGVSGTATAPGATCK